MEDLSFKDLKNKVCVITGGGGVLGNSMARGLASAGVITVILDINEEAATKAAAAVSSEFKVKSYGLKANVLDKGSLEAVHDQIIAEVGEIDMLINGAGGNSPKATTKLEAIFKQVQRDMFRKFLRQSETTEAIVDLIHEADQLG